MKIYVASSWRNNYQPKIVIELRQENHEVYDFRQPTTDNYGFQWSTIDSEWKTWTPDQYIQALKHPIAEKGYKYDMDAMLWADVCVLIMPCGRSAHLELGWFVGQEKLSCILHDRDNPVEPELMAKMCDKQFSEIDSLKSWLQKLHQQGSRF